MANMILLTGATGHLGSEMLKELVKEWDVICLSRRPAELDGVDSSLHDKIFNLQLDIRHSKLGEILDALEAILVKKSSKLSGLVNNAYFLDVSSSMDLSSDACESAVQGLFGFHVNLTLEVMKRGLFSDLSSVVNVSSMYARVAPVPDLYVPDVPANPLLYGAMKAALSQSSRYLSAVMACNGVRVNSVSYGPFPNYEVQKKYPDFIAKLAAKTHLGRIGNPEESAGIIRFLLSSESSYITGSDISVDGGWTAW